MKTRTIVLVAGGAIALWILLRGVIVILESLTAVADVLGL